LSTNIRVDFIRQFLVCLFLFVVSTGGYSQERENYILGEEETLEMIVHIWGEVQDPGEYRVADDTNVLELISKAGGTTRYSKLSDVRITRTNSSFISNGSNGSNTGERISRIQDINLDDYLKNKQDRTIPILMPGDVVYVPRNSLSTWQNITGFARDLSVVASVVFLAVRALNEN